MIVMPTIYDVNVDELREVTQEDLDRLVRNEQAIGIFLRGQDALRKMLRAACSGEISIQEFFSLVENMKNYTT